jgi:hypothetical protein
VTGFYRRSYDDDDGIIIIIFFVKLICFDAHAIKVTFSKIKALIEFGFPSVNRYP